MSNLYLNRLEATSGEFFAAADDETHFVARTSSDSQVFSVDEVQKIVQLFQKFKQWRDEDARMGVFRTINLLEKRQ